MGNNMENSNVTSNKEQSISIEATVTYRITSSGGTPLSNKPDDSRLSPDDDEFSQNNSGTIKENSVINGRDDYNNYNNSNNNGDDAQVSVNSSTIEENESRPDATNENYLRNEIVPLSTDDVSSELAQSSSSLSNLIEYPNSETNIEFPTGEIELISSVSNIGEENSRINADKVTGLKGLRTNSFTFEINGSDSSYETEGHSDVPRKNSKSVTIISDEPINRSSNYGTENESSKCESIDKFKYESNEGNLKKESDKDETDEICNELTEIAKNINQLDGIPRIDEDRTDSRTNLNRSLSARQNTPVTVKERTASSNGSGSEDGSTKKKIGKLVHVSSWSDRKNWDRQNYTMPSVKELAKQFDESTQKREYATTPGQRSPKQVHSLTARSMSKEFREGLKYSCKRTFNRNVMSLSESSSEKPIVYEEHNRSSEDSGNASPTESKSSPITKLNEHVKFWKTIDESTNSSINNNNNNDNNFVENSQNL